MRRKMCVNFCCCFLLYRVFLFARNILFRIISITFRYFADVCYIRFLFSTQRYTIWIVEYAYRCAKKMCIQTDSGYVGTKVNKPMELCLYRWCFQRFNRMLNWSTDIILIRLDLQFNEIFLNVGKKIHSHVNRIHSMLEPNFRSMDMSSIYFN